MLSDEDETEFKFETNGPVKLSDIDIVANFAKPSNKLISENKLKSNNDVVVLSQGPLKSISNTLNEQLAHIYGHEQDDLGDFHGPSTENMVPKLSSMSKTKSNASGRRLQIFEKMTTSDDEDNEYDNSPSKEY